MIIRYSQMTLYWMVLREFIRCPFDWSLIPRATSPLHDWLKSTQLLSPFAAILASSVYDLLGYVLCCRDNVLMPGDTPPLLGYLWEDCVISEIPNGAGGSDP